MDFTFVSQSHNETIQMGKVLGGVLQPGCVIGLEGDLGAGKTCFIKGLAHGCTGVPESDVTSPTFAIMHEYVGAVPFYHFDAYRLAGPDDLETIGFDEYLEGDGVAVIEWADRIRDALPGEYLSIVVEACDEEQRSFTCTAKGSRYVDIMRQFQHALEGTV